MKFEQDASSSQGEKIDISRWNDLDMSMLLVDLIKEGKTSDFSKMVKEIIKEYQNQTGEEPPKIDLIFVAEDLGENLNAQVRNLRFLKALRDNNRINKYLGKIIVKSSDPAFIQVEPNVFASDVSFEVLK